MAVTLIMENQYSKVPNAPMLRELMAMSATEYSNTHIQAGVFGNHHWV